MNKDYLYLSFSTGSSCWHGCSGLGISVINAILNQVQDDKGSDE